MVNKNFRDLNSYADELVSLGDFLSIQKRFKRTYEDQKEFVAACEVEIAKLEKRVKKIKAVLNKLYVKR